MPEIELRDHTTFLLDEADLGLLGDYRWRVTTEGYVARDTHIGGKDRPVRLYLHRLVAGAQPGQDVDHINRNRRDNRRENLRLCTRAQNLQNVAGRGGSSEHRGVSWHKRAARWRADVKVDGKQHYLGLFDTEDAAAEAAREARARLMTHAEG